LPAATPEISKEVCPAPALYGQLAVDVPLGTGKSERCTRKPSSFAEVSDQRTRIELPEIALIETLSGDDGAFDGTADNTVDVVVDRTDCVTTVDVVVVAGTVVVVVVEVVVVVVVVVGAISSPAYR
jgi:hypothetical protein